MIIAVDFDGTIVEHRYPEIGSERPGAVATLLRLQHENPDNKIILWTVREGELLDQAVEWCRQRGLEFYAVNSNYTDQEPPTDGIARKIVADIYIDDRNLGGLPDWTAIYTMITRRWSYRHYLHETARQMEEPPTFWQRLLGRY